MSRMSKHSLELEPADRAVMGGNKQLRNCTRMAVIGHIVSSLLIGMVIGYSFSAMDIDRTLLVADVENYAGLVTDMGHFVNETYRLWSAIEQESVELGFNEIEYGCVEHGEDPSVDKVNSPFIENRALPFVENKFSGVVQSFMPAVDFVVKPAINDTRNRFRDGSQTTFWNAKTRNNHIEMTFEDKAAHKLDKKRLCYFAFQREKKTFGKK